MKRASLVLSAKFLIGALILFFLNAVYLRAQQLEILDNTKIIELVKAGLGDQVIIPKINSSRVAIDTSESALLIMKAAGVSDAVIVALLERSAIRGAKAELCRVNQIKIPGSTEIKVVTTQKISGKKVKIGQSVSVEVAEDVSVSGKIVIRKGTSVKATVSEARKPGMMGRSGRLSIFVESTSTSDGQTIKLRAAKSGKDGDNFGTTYTLVALFGAAGLLKHGKNATINAGTFFVANTDEPKCVGVPPTP